MRGFSSLQVHELEGYAFGIVFIGALIGIVTGVGTLQVQETAKTVIDLFAIGIIILFGWQFRTWTTGQPRKSHAHIMHIFNTASKGAHMSAWEAQGIVKDRKPFSVKDPLFKPILEEHNLQNRYVYGVKYSHVTVIGHSDFTFTSAIMICEVEMEQLYSPIPDHEILYKGFAASVPCAFLSVDTLSVHKVEKAKGVQEEHIPVFLVRKGHYHSQPEQRFKELDRHELGMGRAGAELAEAYTVINIQENLVRAHAEGREEGIRIGRREGEALVEDYMEANTTPGIGFKSAKAHPRLLGGIIALGIVLFAFSYFVGWIRL